MEPGLNDSSWANETGDYDQPYLDIRNTTEYLAAFLLYQYCFPIIIFGGLISNILSILILRRLPNTKCTLGFYLYFYCCMNLATLIIQLLPMWIGDVAQIESPLYYMQDWSCRLWKLVDILLTYPPQWLVAMMALDLCIMIFQPGKVQQMSTRFLAKTKITIVYTVLVFMNFYKTYTFLLTPAKDCVMSQHFVHEPLFQVWEYASAVINSYIPITIVAIGIIANFVGMVLVDISETAKCIELYCVTLALSTVFFLLTSPLIIVNFVTYSLPRENYMEFAHIAVKYQLANRVCILVGYTNMCTTFIIYCACVPDFFNELLILIRCRRRKDNSSIELEEGRIGDTSEKLIVDSEI